MAQLQKSGSTVDAQKAISDIPQLLDDLTISDPLPASPFDGMCCNNVKEKGGKCSPCPNKATFQCQNCELVQYCGKECELAHKETHQRDCGSKYNTASWKPDSSSKGHEASPIAITVFVWGNMPAYDLLKLPTNEGSDYEKELNICFAASGDLRNVFTTVAAIPMSYKGHIKWVINDMNAEVTKKNLLLLLTCLLYPNDEAFVAEAIIHLWYSTKISQRLLDTIQSTLAPIIEKACKIADGKSPGEYMRAAWSFGTRRLEVILSKEHWISMRTIWKPQLQTPENKVTAETSWKQTLRNPYELSSTEATLHLFRRPGARVAEMKFRESGALLPFGAPTEDINTLNPTLFTDKGLWFLPTGSTPLGGWSKKDLDKSQKKYSLPKNDLFGAMFFHVRDLLIKFHRRISKLDIHFVVSNATAQELMAPGNICYSFDRIDTSNIADRLWFGIKNTLQLGRRLNPENPHATLLTYFMHICEELDYNTVSKLAAAAARHAKLGTQPEIPLVDFVYKWLDAKRDYKGAAQAAGLQRKSENTVINRAPCQFLPTDTAADRDVKGFDGGYYVRFFEWKTCSAEERKKFEESGDDGWNLDWVEDPKGVETEVWKALKAWSEATTKEEAKKARKAEKASSSEIV